MEDDGHTAASPPRRRRSRNDGDVKTPVQPVSAVTGAGDSLRTGGIRADLPSAPPPMPGSIRENDGRFKRGGPSPNPGGRPAVALEVRDAARAYTTDMLGVLVGVALDEKAPPAARVTAANAVLDRGHGKPVASVEAKVAVADITALHLAALEELSRGPMS